MKQLLRRYPLEAGLIVLFLFSLLTLFFIAPTTAYPLGSVVHIESGMTVQGAATLLKEKNIIRSESAFTLFVRLFNGRGGVLEGSYALGVPENAVVLAYRFSNGKSGLLPVKVTVPEGSTSREIATIVKVALDDFDALRFEELAKKEEGYLFPDTYFFIPGTPPETVIAVMRSTFDEKIAPFLPAIESFGRPLSDVIVMASLLEKEARQTDTRRTVAGILWKRMENDFPLQVDAVFGYILATSTFSPTFEQLEIDSPYNTYKNLGLPPGPIANPGLDAIEAAITPIKTPYFYYLTGADGNMYYAKTFDEHIANRSKLR